MKTFLLFTIAIIIQTTSINAQIDLPNEYQKNVISLENSNIGIRQRGEGITYLGNGIYKSVKTGKTGYASFKTLTKKAIEAFSAFAVGYGCDYEVLSKVKTSIKYGTGVPRSTVTLKLINKDGTIAITNSEIKKERYDLFNQIKNLNELLELGVLTKEEFDAKLIPLKKKLLGN